MGRLSLALLSQGRLAPAGTRVAVRANSRPSRSTFTYIYPKTRRLGTMSRSSRTSPNTSTDDRAVIVVEHTLVAEIIGGLSDLAARKPSTLPSSGRGVAEVCAALQEFSECV